MKKLLIGLSCILLVSCNSTKDSKLIMPSLNSISTPIGINKEELGIKLSSKETFVLYIYSSSCLSCIDFEPILNNYVKEYKPLIYMIDTLYNDFKPNNQYVYYEYTPTISIISKGEKIAQFDAFNNEEDFMSFDKFKNKMDSVIKISNFKEVKTEEELDLLINEKKNFCIYFYWQSCADCIYFKEHFFSDYIENSSTILYAFEMSSYYALKHYGDLDTFNAFMEKYGLSEGHPLGYQTGVVPTLSKYENGILKENRVIYNDIFEKKYAENGDLISLKMVSSYYQDNPYIGKVFTSNEKENAKSMYHRLTLDYFKNKVKEIL